MTTPGEIVERIIELEVEAGSDPSLAEFREIGIWKAELEQMLGPDKAQRELEVARAQLVEH